jgi:hypothetical protein
LGWPHTTILQISASQIASITGMSHRQRAHITFLKDKIIEMESRLRFPRALEGMGIRRKVV